MTQPVTGILLAWLILDEEPTSLLWLGGILVMGGALLAQKRSTPAQSAPGPSSAKELDNGEAR